MCPVHRKPRRPFQVTKPLFCVGLSAAQPLNKRCPHMMLERPAWKSKQKQNVVKALYSGNKGMLLRESLGVVTDTSEGIFMKKIIRHLFDQPRVDLPFNVQHVYTAIDPTGGGPSKFAIVSGTRIGGSVTVVLELEMGAAATIIILSRSAILMTNIC